MKKEFTSTYKMLCSSWGIYIQISGNFERKNDGIRISNKIFYENKIENIKLPFNDEKYLIGGLKWVSSLISTKVDSPIKINIQKIQLNLCDYQSEGMFYAIAFWASETFGFQLPEYKSYFKKEKNKYIFPDLELKS